MVHVDEGMVRMQGGEQMCPAVDEGADMHRRECGDVWGCAALDQDMGMHCADGS